MERSKKLKQRKKGGFKKITLEMKEEVVVDESRGFGTAVAVVNSDIGGGGRGVDLALIL